MHASFKTSWISARRMIQKKNQELGHFLTEKEPYHLPTAALDLVSKSCLVASCSKVVSTSLSGKWM